MRTWESDITLLSNPLVVRQFFFVVVGSGLIMAFLLSFIFLVTGEFREIPVMLLISLITASGFGLLLVLVTLIFFRNRVRVRFTVNEDGALWETIDSRVLSANRLVILAGILGKSAQTSGAGALAMSRETEFVSWSDLAFARYNQRHRIVTLCNSWRPLMMLVCLPENYEEVSAYVKARVSAAPAVSKPNRKPLRRAFFRSALISLAAAPLFTLSSSYYYDFDIFLPLLMFLFSLATAWLVPLFGWVVIGCAVIISIQLASLVFSGSLYFFPDEYILLFLTFAGLVYLAWFSWSSVRGKILPTLLED